MKKELTKTALFSVFLISMATWLFFNNNYTLDIALCIGIMTLLWLWE